MNNITKRITITLACLVIAATAYADERVRNVIIGANGQEVTFKIGEHRHIKIINFIHDGDANATGGTLRVSRDNGPTVTLLSATQIGFIETQKDIFIAGPAQVTVASVNNGSVFLAYKIGEH